MFNHSFTIYNKHYDFDRDLDIYQKSEIHGVLWTSQEGHIRRNSLTVSGDKIVIYIPIVSNSESTYVDPEGWSELENTAGKYTITSGYLVVKGVGHADISSLRELKNYFTITTVDFNDFGGDMSNWEVVAK